MSLNYQFEVTLEVDPPTYEFLLSEDDKTVFELDCTSNELNYIFEPEFNYIHAHYPDVPRAAGRDF